MRRALLRQTPLTPPRTDPKPAPRSRLRFPWAPATAVDRSSLSTDPSKHRPLRPGAVLGEFSGASSAVEGLGDVWGPLRLWGLRAYGF